MIIFLFNNSFFWKHNNQIIFSNWIFPLCQIQSVYQVENIDVKNFHNLYELFCFSGSIIVLVIVTTSFLYYFCSMGFFFVYTFHLLPYTTFCCFGRWVLKRFCCFTYHLFITINAKKGAKREHLSLTHFLTNNINWSRTTY